MNSRKLLFAVLFVLGCTLTSFGQILTFDFAGLAGSEATAGSNFNNADLTASTISRGTGLTAAGNGDRFNANNWALTDIPTAISGNKYMQFTITPTAGYQFDVSSIVFQFQRSGTGPSALALRSSVDGYAANLDAEKSITDNTSTQTITFTFAQANSTSAVTYRLYGYAEATTGTGGPGDGTGDDIIVNGTVTPTVTGITTAANGNWNVGSTWVGGVVPTAAQNAIINHAVTLDANVTRNAGTITTVNSGKGILTNSYTYTNNGTTNVEGYITLQNGGSVGGANNLVYSGITSALNFSQNTGIAYAVSAGQRFWPIANPPYNVNITSNSPAQLNMAVGAVEGQLTLGAGINVVTANALTINGTLRINLFGFVDTNAPIYGAASRLLYASGGTYGRGYEWNSLGVGTIGVTPGYPNNVYIQGNTVVDYVNTVVPNAVGIKAIAGNLDIITGCALNMDTGSVPTGGAFIVGGTINVNGPTGAFRLGVGANDDLKVGGSLQVSTTAVFDAKQRKVFFTNNVLQDISGPSLTIPYLVCEPTSGSSVLRLNGASTAVTISAPLGGNAITFNGAGDTFDLNSRALTIGTAGVANVISGAGTFKGTTTSTLNLLGTGSIGTLSFLTGFQNLGTFTVNRTSGAIACVMDSPLAVTTTMNLTAGIVDLNSTTFTLNSAAVVNGASASNYFIADDAFGGILRKSFNSLTSFVFPIGDKTGTMEYSPATFALTAGTGMTTASYIGMSVNDNLHPNMAPAAHSISRYWSVTRYGTINTPTYTFSGTYLPIDVNGTETSSLSQFWNGTAWSAVGTFLFGNTVTYGGCTYLPTSGANHHTGGLRDREINIRQGATNYLTSSTYTFANTPASSFVDVTFTIENLGNANLTIFANPTVTSGGAYSLNPLMPSNVTVTGLGTTTFTIRFAPPTAGLFTGSISIVNSDSDENPYVINFTGNGTGSSTSDILKVNTSEPLTIPSTTTGTIATITDGIEAWRFTLRDGGYTATDADVLATTMTDLVITQSAGDQIGNWDESIADIVLVNLATNAIEAHGVVTTNQIQFNTINVVAADNTTVLLGLRLTLKCPLGVGALDGDDFGFSITNANTTFAPSGSGKASFSVQTSTNSRNVIAVVATKLTFTTQPITTGVSIAMSSVVVAATDACGNVDRNKTGSVSLTSSGTMTPVGAVSLSSGSATFTGITHTVVGTDYNLTASLTGLPSQLSTLFDISTITVLNPGDLAVLAVNTSNASGSDEISFVCFRDLLPGTNLFLTDNGYERKFAGFWAGSEGVISITRTASLLPKGTILTIKLTGTASSGSDYDVYVCGAIDTNWTKTVIGGSGFDLNNDDDIYFMQGGVWTNDTGHNSTYTGNVLYAWTESGWDLAPGGDTTKWSTLYPGMECFNTVAPSGDGKVKFNDPVDPDFSTTTNGKYDWIGLINNQANWDAYLNNTDYTAGGYDYAGGCSLVNLATSVYVNGRWSGKVDTNWFNCLNWETLIVPVATTDVVIPTAINDAEIDATAPFAVYSNYIAKVKNLTITGQKVILKDNLANKLEVHGNLTIANTVADGALDMDGGTATDGQLYLYGNWNNNKNNDAFDEGNGTVHFMGSTPQVINAVAPLGTEIFKNVLLDNNFDTAVSNDLFASGDLILNTGKTLDIDATGYATVYNKLTSNGNVVVRNNGQLIQVNDTDTNAGVYTGTKFQVIRNYTAKDIDYVYWGAPTKAFSVTTLPNGNHYEWNPTYLNGNGTHGNWRSPSTGTMTSGRGYIARTYNGSAAGATLPFSFYGQPNNGLINVPIARDNYFGDGIVTGLDYDAEPANLNNVLTTRWDDNWNLVGNPYPSAVNAIKFLTANTNLEGFINIWTHSTEPNSTADPYYYNFGYNYTPADYITYNVSGAVSGPTAFNGNIAAGQGFFVLMNDGPATAGTAFFNNAMRSDIASKLNYDNSQFFRTSSSGEVVSDEKNRIWLDIIAPSGQIDRTLVGYLTGATNDSDRLFDAVTKAGGLKLYSFSNDVPLQPLCIQGKGLPFDAQDKIRLGFKSNSVGNYKIAIAFVDGLFTANQGVYLEDKLLGVIHDLREAPYTFATTKGVFDDRFVLRYTTQALGNAHFDSANQVVVSTNHSQINITSTAETISQVQVFDLLGREVYTMSNLDTLAYSISNNVKNQALIIKVKLTNGVVVSKKIIVN